VTNWNEVRHQVQYRIRNVVRSSRGKSESQRKSEAKGKSKSKNKKEITLQEAVALTASIIIIIMALGGIGLVYNVFAQLA
jgi:hypothetical protein